MSDKQDVSRARILINDSSTARAHTSKPTNKQEFVLSLLRSFIRSLCVFGRQLAFVFLGSSKIIGWLLPRLLLLLLIQANYSMSAAVDLLFKLHKVTHTHTAQEWAAFFHQS